MTVLILDVTILNAAEPDLKQNQIQTGFFIAVKGLLMQPFYLYQLYIATNKDRLQE